MIYEIDALQMSLLIGIGVGVGFAVIIMNDYRRKFKARPYIVVTLNGQRLVMDAQDIGDLPHIVGGDNEYSLALRWLTQSQYEQLKEFDGF